LRPPNFESGASTYSATPAGERAAIIPRALFALLLSNADIPKYNFFLFGVLLVLMTMILKSEGMISNRQRQEELREGEEEESLVETARV
jgi:hypothetical protein